MKWTLAFFAVLAGIVAVSVPWGGRHAKAINALGSTSVQPFAEMLSQEFNRLHPDNTVDVQGGGSTAGVQAAKEGIVDIGMVSRELKADEKAIFTRIEIARDGLAIVVHPSNSINNLTRDQIRRLFVGEVRNWKEVGGPDREVRLITREEGSGTREAFQKLVMHKDRIAPDALTQESSGAVKELVRSDPGAIGYISLGLLSHDLKAIRVGGKPPTMAAVKAPKDPYPLVRPFLFITKGAPTERAKQFIEFVRSDEAQAILEREGLVGIR